MAIEVRAYRIFIATPGGLEMERETFRRVVSEYNETDALPRSVQFVPVGWEDTLASVGRPQALINQDLHTCDYFLIALWDRWGSPPDHEGVHSSGTEEEFDEALQCY